MSDPKQDFLNKARPLAQSLLDYATEAGKAFGITDEEICITVSEDQDNNVENGDVVGISSGRAARAYITLYAGDRSLSFSKNTLNEDTLKAAMLKNMEVIHLAPENPFTRLLEKDRVFKGPLPDLDLYDAHQPDQDALIAYARAVEASARAEPGIRATEMANASKNSHHFLQLATNGLSIDEHATYCQGGAWVIAEDENGMQVGGDYSTARHFSDMAEPKSLGKKAGKDAVAKLSPTLPLTGEMTIVLDNDAAASFFSAVYSAIDGTALYQGTTFLKDKLGQQIMSKCVTLENDPAILRGMSSTPISPEGLPLKKTTFVEDGVLKSYNIGLTESRQLGVAPAGLVNGKNNSRIRPGAQTPEQLMADIKEGIYVTGFDGGTVNINNGTHSRQAHGFLIRDGKVTDTALDGFVVSGNLKEMFMDVALANDTPKQPSTRPSLAAPTTRINKVTIAGR